jgi:hypothetical protein
MKPRVLIGFMGMSRYNCYGDSGLKSEMMKASKDSLFMDDLNDSMKAFETSDAENTKENSEW